MNLAERLDQEIRSLALREREILTELLPKIRELDVSKSYLHLGSPSLYSYLVEKVGYSEGSAQRRIDAARMLKNVPGLAEKLQDGSINLSQVSLVRRALREASKNTSAKTDHVQQNLLISLVENKSYRESEKAVAKYLDLPGLSDFRTKIQSNESVRMELTISKELAEKLKQAQELLSHSVPTKDLVAFLTYVVDKVIDAKTKFKKMNFESAGRSQQMPSETKFKKPRSNSKTHRHMAVEIKRKLFSSADGCDFKYPDSDKKCGSRWQLQVDHIQPVWAGGSNSPENFQLLCGKHNREKYRRNAGIKYLG